jgi:geranylgeranyl pyrophosphate synthase
VLHRYDESLRQVRDDLQDAVAEAPHGALLRPFFTRGKGLRAMMVLAATDAAGGDSARLVPAAVAIELLHAAALFHDDIIDGAEQRRGFPSLHVQVGIGPAIVLGDYLMLLAFSRLSAPANDFDAERTVAALQLLRDCAMLCCRGQVEELVLPAEEDPEQLYFRIVSRKTGAQFVAAASLGALLEGAPPEKQAWLEKYAMNLGIAFQIKDDMLDILGTPEEMGKPRGNSWAEGRPMLPLIYLNQAAAPVGTKLCTVTSRPAGLPRIADLLQECHILDRIEATLACYRDRALRALRMLPPSEGVAALAALAEYAVNRNR